MSAEKRSALMGRIRGKGTKPELAVAQLIRAARLSAEEHCGDLPGRPDFVFRDARVVVFVDGDFWHGWRFPAWSSKLSPAWSEKIERNRVRDRRTHAKLRRQGWRVLRLWEHQVARDPETCRERILLAVGRTKKQPASPGI